MPATLQYVPRDEMRRIATLPAPAPARAVAFAVACRINALYMIARAGSGHPGTSFSCLDVLAWLFLEELRRTEDGGARDCYFSSKGHDAPALYAVLAGLGHLDFELIHALRRLGGLPGHPDVATPGCVTNTGSLGMGISKAKGMILANRLRGVDARVFVLTGDGELQEGQIWESLATAVHRRLGELTVIVDANRIQSDTWVAETSDLGDLAAKFRAFGWHVDRCDGHDMAALAAAFARRRAVGDRPAVLIADTVKGRGVSFMEPGGMDPVERIYRFHSGAPDDDVYAKAAAELVGHANRALAMAGAHALRLATAPRPVTSPPAPAQRLVTAYGRALVRQGGRRPDLVALDADLALDCGLLPFRQKFPERFFECGIAEQDMVSQAGGMALRGLLPVVHSFACFLSSRPNEQIYNNATERTRIVYVGSLAGVLPAGPGHSHQAVRDIAALGAIPGLVLVQPCSEREVELALDWAVEEATTSVYIRLVSVPVEVPYTLPDDYRLVPGRGVRLRDGDDAIVLGHGPVMLAQAHRAAELLAATEGLHVAVVNLPWLNHVDAEWLAATVARAPWLFTLDDHQVDGGQGERVLARLAEVGGRLPRVRRLGLTRLPLCGAGAEVLQAHGLDAESLAGEIREAVRGCR